MDLYLELENDSLTKILPMVLTDDQKPAANNSLHIAAVVSRLTFLTLSVSKIVT